ncbi:MAG: TatD family hydrolase [Atopobiaceae bacterium]|nr:TatD family hydrolase [Atopobiaceae bacterium]
MYIDTHAHYNLPTFDEDRDETLGRVRTAGVEKLICPAISFESNTQMMECLAGYDNVYFAVGIHPKRVCPIRGGKRAGRDVPSLSKLQSGYEERARMLARLEGMLAAVAELASSGGRVVAVGETGLDYSLNPSEFERRVQMAAFRKQVEIALKARLPLVLHIRDAHRDAAKILHMYRTELQGSVHCFSLGPDEAKEYLAMGLSLGIGGKVSYEGNVGLREAVAIAPLDRILLETDAPYVLPSGFPFRRNDSTAIPMIAREVARLRGISVEEVAHATTANAERVFFELGTAKGTVAV